MKMTYRILSFLARLAAGVFHFGPWGAVRVFLLYRWKRSDEVVSLSLRQLRRPFWFRARSDRAVLCMFYKPGYRIVDCYGPHQVRVIIDAGANIGDSTARFRRFHPLAQILAIEADEGNFRLLEQNFANDQHTVLLHRGLWSHSGELRVRSTWANIASRVDESTPHGSGISIMGCTIPELIAQFHLKEIDILKLDIEGAEAIVFQTEDRAWLHQVRCIIFECCDADDAGTTMSIFATLTAAGLNFNCHVCGENIIMIRSDTPWHLVEDLWMHEKPAIAPHIAEHMLKLGLLRCDQ